VKKLAWRIRHAIAEKTRQLCVGSLDRAEAERRAIREVAAAEKVKAREGRTSVGQLFEQPQVFRNPAIPAHVWEAAAERFTQLMMRTLTLAPTPKPPPPSPTRGHGPVSPKQPMATGGPKQPVPRPTEPSRSPPLLYVSGGSRRSAQNITREFRNSPTTQNWLASRDEENVRASLRGAR
jgi:hypothetical protein